MATSPPHRGDLELPAIKTDEDFAKVVRKLSVYITEAVSMPSTFEQLRTTSAGNNIRVLVDHIVNNVTNPAIVNALLTLKWNFSSLEPDDRGLNETRANACEIIAWRFLTRLAERDAIDYCLYELPPANSHSVRAAVAAIHTSGALSSEADEQTTLLPQFRSKDHVNTEHPTPRSKRQQLIRSVTQMGSHLFESSEDEEEDEDDPTSSFIGLNALEIAAIADAKKFLSQRLVQKIIYGIWIGDITFWESLSIHTQKKPGFYNKRTADPYSRLRVPKYIKAFEVLFFASFLALYYAVLVERNPYRITPLEVCLYVWLFAFAYDEMSEFVDAGLFYYADFWSSWDLTIIAVGVAFMITRIVGLIQDSDETVDIAFDILSLEALFLVPRICSLLSLHPYFGTLIPCLKEMTKDFVKFMAVVAILYVGFLTTFTLLARDHFTLSQMSWILIKVFFGSSYVGFDVMHDISPQLGPPLMIIFVVMTNILLITSLISILSNSFAKVTAHAREEYLYVYSVYVLEASTSNRLTHFFPPLNLLPLLLIRPLRLFVPSDQLRGIRIALLKATHTPIVGAILVYEAITEKLHGRSHTFSSLGPADLNPKKNKKAFLENRSQPLPSPNLHFVDGNRELGAPGLASPSAGKGKKDKELKGAKMSAANGTVVIESQRALERKVEDLSSKIEELTALILAQQHSNSTE